MRPANWLVLSVVIVLCITFIVCAAAGGAAGVGVLALPATLLAASVLLWGSSQRPPEP